MQLKIPRQSCTAKGKMILLVAYGSSYIMSEYLVTSSLGRYFLLRKRAISEPFAIMADFQYKLCNYKIRETTFLLWYYCHDSWKCLCIWTQSFAVLKSLICNTEFFPSNMLVMCGVLLQEHRNITYLGSEKNPERSNLWSRSAVRSALRNSLCLWLTAWVRHLCKIHIGLYYTIVMMV